MPPRSKILSMPKDLQEELNARLIADGFRNYEQLADWLNEELERRGMELRVTHSVVWRHGANYEEKLDKLRAATEQAKAIAEGAGDDEGALNDAVVRLIQERMFDLFMRMPDIDPDKVDLANLLKGIAQVTRASVSQKQFMQEVRKKANEAVKNINATAKKAGISEDTIRKIEEDVLGIVR